MNILKRIIAVFLATIMTNVSVAVYAENDNLIIDDDFENEISSSVWTGDYDIENGVNKYLKSVADKTQFYCRLGESITEGAAIISYDVMLMQNAPVRIKQVWDADGKRSYFIRATSEGKLLVNSTEFGKYTPEEWFNITEIVDVANKKVIIYLNYEYINEYDWYNDGEAVGINNIQTQYDSNTVYIDNAYVKKFASRQDATSELAGAFAKKVKLEKSAFDVGANSTLKNSITVIEDGVEIISYDINFVADSAAGVRLMQAYDNTLSANNRTLLVQTSSTGAISVNEKNTGCIWDSNADNNISVIYNAKTKESTVFYNGLNLGTYGVFKENAANIARIDTQNNMSVNTVSVSNVWARRFGDYDAAVKYYNALNNLHDDTVIEYYDSDKQSVAGMIDEYTRAIDSLFVTDEENKILANKIWNLIPYTKIFAENFDEVSTLEGYTVSTNAVVSKKSLMLTNSGNRARILKSVTGYDEFICEFDFMQENISNVDSLVRITDSSGTREAIRLMTQNGKVKVCYGMQSDGSYYEKVIFDSYAENLWYNVKLYCNLKDKITYVYIDNKILGAYEFISNDISNLSRVFDTYTDTQGTYYIDNIKIYNDELFAVNTEKEINVPVNVSDLSGVGVTNKLYRRGFTLEKSHIYDTDSLIFVDKDGNFVPSYFSPMEYYEDGSIKWALLSFVCSLDKNQEKEFYVVNSEKEKSYGNIDFSDGILFNEKFKISVTKDGIDYLMVDEEQCLDGLYLYYNDTKLPFTSYDILQENDLYIKIRLNAASDGQMKGELYITLWQNSDEVDVEYRFTALKDVTVSDMGCWIECANNTTYTIKESAVEICTDTSGLGIVSADIERFAEAVSKNTGFFADDNIIRFEPIINDTEFKWYDGLSRTNHFTITTNNTDDALQVLKKPTAVSISAEQFKKCGIIQGTSSNAVFDRITNSLKYVYDKRNGCFEAGYIPWIIDEARSKVENSSTQHGETDYNIALLQLQNSDPILYNMICESGECRADVSVYKGGISGAYGAVRYRTGTHMTDESDRFKTSHPYYGDASGMYMTYLLSGNEYLRESFIAMTDHIYNNIEQGKSELGKYPSMVSWSDGVAKNSNYGESRYMIQIRPLMMAYTLTSNKKYKEAVNYIVDWAKNAQTEEGYWYQAYYDDKTPLIQSGQTQPAVKNYIMLYGARGLSYLVDNVNDETALGVLIKFSDFLCNEVDTYGVGLWSPTGNAELYKENEDGTRGKTSMQDIMAAEILWRTYQKTNDEKYLDCFLQCLNVWISSLGPGGLPASVSYLKDYYDGSVGSAQASQNLTLISFAGEIERFLKENEQLVYNKGFGQLCHVFKEGANATVPLNVSGHSYPELTSSIYNDSAFFVMNVNGYKSGNYYKKYTSSVVGTNLWTGFKNIVSSNGNVSLNKVMNQFDMASGVKCPITLSGNKSTVEAYVNEYSAQSIKVKLVTNEELKLKIADGIFDTENGYYTYFVEVVEDGFLVTIENAETGITKTGEINIEVNKYPVEILEYKFLDANLEETTEFSNAKYISDIQLVFDGNVDDADIYIAQYNENDAMENVNRFDAKTGVNDIMLEISQYTDLCKIMVWSKLTPQTENVIIER